jgi:hypothetical protein
MKSRPNIEHVCRGPKLRSSSAPLETLGLGLAQTLPSPPGPDKTHQTPHCKRRNDRRVMKYILKDYRSPIRRDPRLEHELDSHYKACADGSLYINARGQPVCNDIWQSMMHFLLHVTQRCEGCERKASRCMHFGQSPFSRKELRRRRCENE